MLGHNLISHLNGGVVICSPVGNECNCALAGNGKHEILDVIVSNEIRLPFYPCSDHVDDDFDPARVGVAKPFWYRCTTRIYDRTPLTVLDIWS